MFGHMLYFGEQCGFVYTESFKLLPDFLLLRLADDIRFIVEVEYCWFAFVTVYVHRPEKVDTEKIFQLNNFSKVDNSDIFV